MKIYIALAAILIAGTAQAQTGGDRKSTEYQGAGGDTCKAWGSVAENVMRDRQSGRPLHDLMEKASSATTNPLMRNIIIRAYERPIYPDEKGRTRAVADFRNDAELLCYKAQKS